jgi:hypothetical protein
MHVQGHSNGGQGVWHLAVHYPDRIIAGKKKKETGERSLNPA